MEKEVLIHVRGLQLIDGGADQEPIEVVVPGLYYFRNGSHFLRYEEMQEEFDEPTTNLIKMTPGGVEVHKQGLVNVHMTFVPGKKNIAIYKTPLGTVEMGIEATDLMLHEEEEEIRVNIEYALDMNEEHVADCALTIQIQPRGSKDFVL